MLTRFKQNIKMYPHTAKVVGTFYLAAILGSVITGSVMHLELGAQLLTLAELVGLVAFVDFLTYLWVTSDSIRLSHFLELLNRFEGREIESADENCPDCGTDECNCPPPTDLWNDEQGQDVAEYAVMLAVMLIIVVGTVRLIGSSAGNVFSEIGSKIGGQ